MEAPILPPRLARPDASVQGRLPCADDYKALGAISDVDDVARGYATYAVSHLERWRAGRGNVAFAVGGIDQPALHVNLYQRAGEPRDEPVFADIVAAGEVAHSPGWQEMVLHYIRVVRADLVGTGELVVAC